MENVRLSGKAQKIYSVETRNRVLIGIAFVESAERSPAGPDAELAKEDEIPQRSEIRPSPTRQEVIAADAHHKAIR